MMIEVMAKEIVDKNQKYKNKFFDRKVRKDQPVLSYDVIKETILNAMDFLSSEKIPRSEWPGMVAGNIADVTGIEYLDIYAITKKYLGGKNGAR